jgi:hypothetical protein
MLAHLRLFLEIQCTGILVGSQIIYEYAVIVAVSSLLLIGIRLSRKQESPGTWYWQVIAMMGDITHSSGA